MVYKKDLELQVKWGKLLTQLDKMIGRRPKDLNAVLFLIGVQELGAGNVHYEKEEKQDLMHIAICKLLSYSGFYTLKGVDNEGWPHWELTKALPKFDLLEQEKLLKMHALEYFENEIGLSF